MLMTKYPEVECEEWSVKNCKNDYKVICRFPAGTIFTIVDLSLVECCDPFFIENVWIEPEREAVKLVTQVKKYDKPFTYNKQTIKILRHRLTSKHTKKLETDDVNVFDNDGNFIMNHSNTTIDTNNNKTNQLALMPPPQLSIEQSSSDDSNKKRKL